MGGASPTSRTHTMQHPLARMLPIQREQEMVYRMGEKHPPSGHLDGYGPMWEAVTIALGATGTNTQTLQARVNLQRDFTLISISSFTSSNVAGGFRVTFFDVKKQRRFADRPYAFSNYAGPAGGIGGGFPAALFLREPYRFNQPDSQILIQATNFEAVPNTVQLAFYGLVLRFNEVRAGVATFPGGSLSNPWAGWGQQP